MVPSIALATEGSPIRWCDWLDAVIHYHTHAHWHLAAACFDPDPDKRELASLGTIQRQLTVITDQEEAHWEWHLYEAADRFKNSPPMAHPRQCHGRRLRVHRQRHLSHRSKATLARRSPLALPGSRHHDHRPLLLVTHHKWTYRDLTTTVPPALHRPTAYPCDREQAFAAYCTNVLGLRKTTNPALIGLVSISASQCSRLDPRPFPPSPFSSI